MGKQLVIHVNDERDPKRIRWLEQKLASILLFWPSAAYGKKSVEKLCREVDRGRWEIEVTAGDSPHDVPPPLRAAGRTRLECLQAAVLAGAEAIRQWGITQRRRAEVATDRAVEAERWVAENMREVEGT